jgi:hypothetical protein
MASLSSTSPPAPFYTYLNPSWIDFRVLTGPDSYPFDAATKDVARVMYAFNVAQAIVLPLILGKNFS